MPFDYFGIQNIIHFSFWSPLKLIKSLSSMIWCAQIWKHRILFSDKIVVWTYFILLSFLYLNIILSYLILTYLYSFYCWSLQPNLEILGLELHEMSGRRIPYNFNNNSVHPDFSTIKQRPSKTARFLSSAREPLTDFCWLFVSCTNWSMIYFSSLFLLQSMIDLYLHHQRYSIFLRRYHKTL